MTNSTASFTLLKENMVKQQLRTNEIVDKTILKLFDTIPRHEFVPSNLREFAYSDLPIPLPHDQQMFIPEEEGRLLQALQLQGHETILEVGTGSGYLTALLSQLGKKVISLDCFADFTRNAASKISEFGYPNIEFITEDAAQGYLNKAPYDVVVMTGSIPTLSKTLTLQIVPGGKLFAIIGEPPIMSAYVFTLDHQEKWTETLLFKTNTPALINKLKLKNFVF